MIKNNLFTLRVKVDNCTVYHSKLQTNFHLYGCEVCKENRKLIPHKIKKEKADSWIRIRKTQYIYHLDLYSPLYCTPKCNRTMHVNGWWDYEFWQEEKNPGCDYKSTFTPRKKGFPNLIDLQDWNSWFNVQHAIELEEVSVPRVNLAAFTWHEQTERENHD